MNARYIHKLEALSMIVGPAVALLFFLVEPGGMLIDSADSTDYVGRITALSSNSALARVAGLFVPLGLLIMLYGMSGVNRATVERDTAGAASRFGILSVTVGGFGWIIADGANHLLARVDVASERALEAAVPLLQASDGISLISGMAVSLGLLAFSLSISARETSGIHRTSALVITVVSAISLVALIVGHSAGSQAMVTLGRACYFPWVIWSATLGARFFKAAGPTAAARA